METTANKFPQAATIALGNIAVRGAVERSTRYVTDRVSQMREEMPHYAALRQQGRGAKLRALQQLPAMLEQFEARLSANGGHTHWARDAAEANQLILEICRANHLKRGVKSKSMATEEIELVPFLEGHGIEIIETDLGEFIVQISGDRPSHIVMPVMHRPQEEILNIFREKLGMEARAETTAEEMTAFARQYLREKFLSADFGMSGGNFLIAETGSLVIITNEGNGRLSTSLPDVHIAVVGIEKIIPTWRDFATLVQLLAMSGAGQTLTVYVNIINGPKAESDEDGPSQFHLILLDNGRSQIYASEYREALACLRCGACLNVCPVYRNVGGHAYGSVYSGPIGSVVTPGLAGKEAAQYLPFASSLCGACQQACPVDIHIPDMLLRLRRDLQSAQPTHWRLGMKGWAFANRHPLLFHAGGQLAERVTRRQARRAGALKQLPPPFDRWTEQRDFPPFAPQSFRSWWQERSQKTDKVRKP